MMEMASFGENSYFLKLRASQGRPVVDGVTRRDHVEVAAEGAARGDVL